MKENIVLQTVKYSYKYPENVDNDKWTLEIDW